MDYLSFRQFPELGDADIEEIKKTIKGCIKSVTGFVQYETQKRKHEHRKNIISGELIAHYRKSKICQSLLSRPLETIDQVNMLRNHILLDVQLCNGKRTGIYENLYVADINNAEKVSNGFVVLVAEGKTFKSSGAAGILFDPKQYSAINTYIEKYRYHLNPKTEQVFCKESGEMSTTSDLGIFLQDAWTHFGNRENLEVGKVNFTLIRKTLVTLSRENGVDLETQRKMAAHMDHTVATANRFYDVSTGINTTSVFRDIISSFAVYGDLEEEDISNETEDQYEVLGSSWAQQAQNKDLGEGTSGAVALATTKTKKAFSDEQKAMVRKIFRSIIIQHKVNKAPLRKADVTRELNSSKQGKDLLDLFTLDQIYNRVRTEIRYN